MSKLGPKWLKNAVFYQIYPSSFADGNGDGMGDLRGIAGKLDYLVSLGVNAIWLNPCFASSFHDGGYDITDFYHVDPRFGSDSDLETLIAEAHKRNIRICLDIVAGHTSVDHPWFRASAEAEKNQYSNYYIWTDDWMRPTDGYKMEAGIGDRNGCFMVNYFSVQPALNYGFAKIDPKTPWQLPVNHPDVLKVRNELKEIFRFFLAKGVDGFRVDMACSLVKNDPGRKETIKLWQEIRDMFDREYPEAVLISEWTYAPQALKAGFHCDFMIHCGTPAYTTLFRNETKRDIFNKFPRELFYEADGNDYRTLNRNSYFDANGKGSAKIFFDIYLDHWKRTKNKGFISIPSGNHDLPRVSDFRSEKELKTVFAFLLTMPGVPFIYYGDEIGMRNLKDLPGKEGGYTRTQARTPMQWDDSLNHGFSVADKEKLYLPVDSSPDAPTVKSQQQRSDSLLNCVKKLIALRLSSVALQACGKIELLHCDYPTVYLRSFGRERYLIALQPADHPFEKMVKLAGIKNLTVAYTENMNAEVTHKGIKLNGSGTGFGIWML